MIGNKKEPQTKYLRHSDAERVRVDEDAIPLADDASVLYVPEKGSDGEAFPFQPEPELPSEDAPEEELMAEGGPLEERK